MSTKSSPNPLLIAGVNSKFKKKGVKAAGFWVGLWHGIIAPLVFLVSLFNNKWGIYETNNNGAWYNFGFLLGIGVYGQKVYKQL